jgi:hypothetical protein
MRKENPEIRDQRSEIRDQRSEVRVQMPAFVATEVRRIMEDSFKHGHAGNYSLPAYAGITVYY